jgi:hypothetical protein
MAKKKTPAKKSRPRELIAPRGDKRYVRRNAKGEFKDVVDVSKSLKADKRQKSKKAAKKGYGDQGDAVVKVYPRLTRDEAFTIDLAMQKMCGKDWRDRPEYSKLAKKLSKHIGNLRAK